MVNMVEVTCLVAEFHEAKMVDLVVVVKIITFTGLVVVVNLVKLSDVSGSCGQCDATDELCGCGK